MAKVTVKLTLFPEPQEVDEDELPSLRQQGLLDETPTPEAAAEPPVVKATRAVKESN